MKKNILISIKLSIAMIVLCCVLYVGLIALIGRFAQGGGDGEKVLVNGKVAGYALLGQKFTEDRYFWGRPSAVDYNAAGSGGSNKSAANPDYLAIVQQRIDSFLVHNPAVTKNQVPAELVTASGSGLDPDISPVAAYIQVKRIASVRNIEEEVVRKLIADCVHQPLAGPATLNVLKLNIALDTLSSSGN